MILDRLFNQDHDSSIMIQNRCRMDVVYNHTFSTVVLLSITVPDYYRMNPDGTFKTGTGVRKWPQANTKCTRRYMIDSLLYWVGMSTVSFRLDRIRYPCRQFVGHWIEVDPRITYGKVGIWGLVLHLMTVDNTKCDKWILQWWSALMPSKGGEVYGSIKAGFVSG